MQTIGRHNERKYGEKSQDAYKKKKYTDRAHNEHILKKSLITVIRLLGCKVIQKT